MDVNLPEYEKQRKEDMLKGDYVKLEIIIPSEENSDDELSEIIPFIHLKQHNCSPFDMEYYM